MLLTNVRGLLEVVLLGYLSPSLFGVVLHARSIGGSFRGHQPSLPRHKGDLPCHEGLLVVGELLLSSEELLLKLLYHRSCRGLRRRGPAHIKKW
jgi:hypothetical protein